MQLSEVSALNAVYKVSLASRACRAAISRENFSLDWKSMVPKVQNQLQLSVIRAKLHWPIGLLGRPSQKSTRDLSQVNTEVPFPTICGFDRVSNFGFQCGSSVE